MRLHAIACLFAATLVACESDPSTPVGGSPAADTGATETGATDAADADGGSADTDLPDGADADGQDAGDAGTDVADAVTDTAPDADTGLDISEDTGPGTWLDPRVRILTLDDSGAASDTVTFDDGAAMSDLDWAMNPRVACWDSATTTPFFEGEHVLFGLDGTLDPWQEVTITVTPEGNVEANVYVIEQRDDRFSVPPEIEWANYCHTTGRLGNAGEATEITFRVHDDPQTILFGISRRTSGRDGSIAVGVQVTPLGEAEQCYEATPSPVRWPDHVTRVFLDEDGRYTRSRDLSDGAPVCGDLDYLDSAFCVPETQLDRFAGAHTFYALEDGLPERSVVTITATPDPGVDVNLYGSFQGFETGYEIPPLYPLTNCESSTSYSRRNPGEPETISFVATTNPYNIFFAVAGDDAQGRSGGYTLDVEVVTADPTDLCTEEEYDEVRGLSAFPSQVTTLALDGGVYTGSGDAGAADPLCTLDWADDSDVACFPATQFEAFSGGVELFALPEAPPAGSRVTARVIPRDGASDPNLFAYMMGERSFYTPPYVPNAITCEASFPQVPFVIGSNPGETEEVSFLNPTDNVYNYLFAVAAPEGVDDAAFDIEVTVDVPPPPHCPESLPGATYPTWPSFVETVGPTDEESGPIIGSIDDGTCTNLDWMSESDIACVPATQFEAFEGSHRYFALGEPLPPRSELTIRLTEASDDDLNLYGYQIGETRYPVPPAVSSVIACEVDGDPRGPTTAAQEIHFSNPSETNAYNVFFGVGGPAGVTTGDYEIEIDLRTAVTHCPGSLDRPTSYDAWPSTLVPLGDEPVSGDLADGGCLNLEFADDSDVACFPAPDFSAYEGNVVEYLLDDLITPGQEVTVTVTPEPGVDVNVFGYLVGDDNVIVPPHVPSVLACEATPAPRRLTGPGAVEALTFVNPVSNPGSYRIYFGVAGPAGVTSGGYEIAVSVAR